MELCYSPLVKGGNLMDSDTDVAVYLEAYHVEALNPLNGHDRAAYIVEYVLPKASPADKELLTRWLKAPEFFADCLADVDF